MMHADSKTLGMPGARAQALVALAATAASQPDLFSPSTTLDQAIARLRALRGIGEWTAQYIAMRALREPDAFPAADIGLMRALASPDGQRPTAIELLARAEGWRPWRAYAAQHLWTADAAVTPVGTPVHPKEIPHAQAVATAGAVHGSVRQPDRNNADLPR
jgi:AraC family transcriptional regulator of adaptative response / DNA-3-methyladenine glycosylase II